MSRIPYYSRPQLRRDDWWPLDGLWQFAFDPSGDISDPDEPAWDRLIEVPFAPETPASGIGDPDFHRACWYRRTFVAPELAAGQRLILRFGAVDYKATVWLNGSIVTRHTGGYTPFFTDITDVLEAGSEQTLVVCAEDDPHDLTKPRGKQDWLREPHAIWYPRTSGIWQSVWLERVCQTHIRSLRWTSSLERWEVGLDVAVADPEPGLRLRVLLRVGEQILADDSYALIGGEVTRRINLSDPGIDDFRNELLWSPERPTLIEASIALLDAHGGVLDNVQSYTALRSIMVQGDRVLLNGRPYPLHLVLDQGYWPESGLTAPDDEALRRDVELAKALGFNGVRKHQKIEDPRYFYWADRLGLLVWEEMPSAYRFTKKSIERLTREWLEVIERDESHPCVIAWVPFNESWGIPDLPAIVEQRHWVQAMYHLTKTLDPSRPVIGNDGWEAVATDIIGIHDYEANPQQLARRYATDEDVPRLLQRERPGGRLLTVEGYTTHGQPLMLTEFGGIALSEDPAVTWGYSRAHTPEEFLERYRRLLSAVHGLPLLAGFCYTQFTDTYQETNGLLYADRRPKAPLNALAAATRGVSRPREESVIIENLLRLSDPPPDIEVLPVELRAGDSTPP